METITCYYLCGLHNYWSAKHAVADLAFEALVDESMIKNAICGALNTLSSFMAHFIFGCEELYHIFRSLSSEQAAYGDRDHTRLIEVSHQDLCFLQFWT